MTDESNVRRKYPTYEEVVIDALSLDHDQLEDRLVHAIQDRDAYRLLATTTLTQVQALTTTNTRLRERNAALGDELRLAYGIPTRKVGAA
jgi:hypothetical protein